MVTKNLLMRTIGYLLSISLLFLFFIRCQDKCEVLAEEVWCEDKDGDDYSTGNCITISNCTDAPPDGYRRELSLNGSILDCDDNNPNAYPGAPEICDDQIDQNCDGMDTDCATGDLDGDGWSVLDGDCNDNSSLIYPGAFDGECCDGDRDCDGEDCPPLWEGDSFKITQRISKPSCGEPISCFSDYNENDQHKMLLVFETRPWPNTSQPYVNEDFPREWLPDKVDHIDLLVCVSDLPAITIDTCGPYYLDGNPNNPAAWVIRKNDRAQLNIYNAGTGQSLFSGEWIGSTPACSDSYVVTYNNTYYSALGSFPGRSYIESHVKDFID